MMMQYLVWYLVYLSVTVKKKSSIEKTLLYKNSLVNKTLFKSDVFQNAFVGNTDCVIIGSCWIKIKKKVNKFLLLDSYESSIFLKQDKKYITAKLQPLNGKVY